MFTVGVALEQMLIFFTLSESHENLCNSRINALAIRLAERKGVDWTEGVVQRNICRSLRRDIKTRIEKSAVFFSASADIAEQHLSVILLYFRTEIRDARYKNLKRSVGEVQESRGGNRDSSRSNVPVTLTKYGCELQN